MQINFDPIAIGKELHAKAESVYKERVNATAEHAVNALFKTPVAYSNFAGGEAYVMINDMAVSYLLADNIKAKTDKVVAHHLEKAIVSVCEKAAEHYMRKHAFTTVKELAEKEPQALLQLILNHQPTQKE